MLAACCVIRLTALQNAAASAKATARIMSLPCWLRFAPSLSCGKDQPQRTGYTGGASRVTLRSGACAESPVRRGLGLEPQSTGLFLVLMAAFCALLECVVMARQLAPGGKHNMATWRALVPPLLEWMTPRLAYAGRHPALAVARAAGRSVRYDARHHGRDVLRK